MFPFSYLYCDSSKQIQVNFELLLRQYLYNQKFVSYPGIGKLTFGSNAQLSDSQDKGEAQLLQDLHFTYNLNEGIDMDFVAFVSSQTGKIKPLAAADIESYFMLSKQFINIGKSFIVDGIGTVDKQDNGTYSFTPGYFLPISEASAAPHKPLKIREAVPVIPKSETKPQPFAINKKAVLGIVAALSLVLIVWAAYYFIFSKTNTSTTNATLGAKDTSNGEATLKDTPAVSTLPPTALSTGGFKAVIDQRFTRSSATARAAKLRSFGHDAQVDSAGPSTFLIFVPVKDTTISVDTLKLTEVGGKRPKFLPN